jgi:hypothetical protein
MTEVMNQAQALSGRRISDMPLQRMSSVVVMKFNEPSNWPMQKMPIEACPKNHAPDLGRGRHGTDRAQRGVLRPAAQSGPITHKERGNQNKKADEGDPERHHVEVRKRHVFGAGLDGQEEIAERGERARW